MEEDSVGKDAVGSVAVRIGWLQVEMGRGRTRRGLSTIWKCWETERNRIGRIREGCRMCSGQGEWVVGRDWEEDSGKIEQDCVCEYGREGIGDGYRVGGTKCGNRIICGWNISNVDGNTDTE